DLARQINENLSRVRARIADAAARSGRAASEVRLIAVTKYVDEPVIRAVVGAGCRTLGESRPQQLWDRAERLADLDVAWHLIGHLQRNKVRRTLPLAGMVESVDTPQLLETIDRVAGELALRTAVLLEVNVSGEEAKYGLAPGDVEPLLTKLPEYPHVEVRGLMCMAGLSSGPEQTRHEFATLRELRDRLRSNSPPGVSLDELSMGMSGDYEAAIEEGATMVRIGSALFEGLVE
ncbi:MAG: YggS family pyridoxal phosphate-dependent enzyme, partial [Thermoguttaceae bacterium]|nr:YggS family pyridoxal phosphate-dependent enzyme [Thermoguttaceae bacterium]